MPRERSKCKLLVPAGMMHRQRDPENACAMRGARHCFRYHELSRKSLRGQRQPKLMNATAECIEVCNSLLRGELSAIETYEQAIGKFQEEPDRGTLQEVRDEHERSAQRLREHLIDMGAAPATDSGAWGSFAQAVEGTAKLLGESPALAALEAGENHGIDEYEEALRNPNVMEEIKTVIRGDLLPALSDHVATLGRLRRQ